MPEEGTFQIVNPFLARGKKPVRGLGAKDLLWNEPKLCAEKSKFERGVMDNKFTGFENFALLGERGVSRRSRSVMPPDGSAMLKSRISPF